MGAKEGAVSPRVDTTRAAKYLRRHDPGSPTALDRRLVARHLSISERGIRVVQPDGGPPRREIHAPGRPQGQIFGGRLPERSAPTTASVFGSDRPPEQVNPGDDNSREHHLRRVGWREGNRLGRPLPRYGAKIGKPKPTSICPFLFHLYEGQGLLMADEELDYRTAKEMAGYRITPDPYSRPGTDEDEPAPTSVPAPQPGPSRTPNRRRKSTYRAPSGSPPVWSRGPSSLVPPEPQPKT